MFVRFGYLPKTFMQLIIIPLVKCKSGDLSDVNNYRAISMSTAMSKLFEYAIENLYSPIMVDNSVNYIQ